MKKMMLTLSALAITLGVATQASGNRLAEEGRFMQGPDVIECNINLKAARCRYEGLRERERVLLTDNTVLDLNTYRMPTCMDGICEDRTYGFVGRVPESVTQLYIPLYYYVWGERDGRPVAYKRGTGPARDQFPAWAVGNPNQQTTRFDLFENRYRIHNVRCSEESMVRNECRVTIGDYRDIEGYSHESDYFSREEILETLKFADMSFDMIDCWDHVCRNHRGDYIGLDPRSDFWQD